jgi:YidC/Oxa1 family membrane protein insertase
MQYGWFWFVSRPLNWLLNTYHGWLDGIARKWSWGLAIILLTITVRIIIWPLHAKSTHTMKRMAKLKPEMDKLKEKYPDDPNKLNTEMMGLYRKFGINPLGGCLPMFIQLPIFFGFYRMLQYAVELRGQGFLWVNDLSQPDTLGTCRHSDQPAAGGDGHHQLPADQDDSDDRRQDAAAHHHVHALHVLLLLL